MVSPWKFPLALLLVAHRAAALRDAHTNMKCPPTLEDGAVVRDGREAIYVMFQNQKFHIGSCSQCGLTHWCDRSTWRVNHPCVGAAYHTGGPHGCRSESSAMFFVEAMGPQGPYAQLRFSRDDTARPGRAMSMALRFVADHAPLVRLTKGGPAGFGMHMGKEQLHVLEGLAASEQASVVVAEMRSVVAAVDAQSARPPAPAPVYMPAELWARFTFGGRIPQVGMYYNSTTATATMSGPGAADGHNEYAGRYLLRQVRGYSGRAFVDGIARAKAQRPFYYPGADKCLFEALRDFGASGEGLLGRHVGVIGSGSPWYEIIAVVSGAATVTVVDHQSIVPPPADVTFQRADGTVTLLREVLLYTTPHEYALMQRQHCPHNDHGGGGGGGGGCKGAGWFDAVLSVSSVEHGGLGRYGDPIDPDGDLRAMARHRSMLRAGGLMYLAVPIGRDCVIWNAGRVYGRTRLVMLLRGWEVVGFYGPHATNFDKAVRDGNEEWNTSDAAATAGVCPERGRSGDCTAAEQRLWVAVEQAAAYRDCEGGIHTATSFRYNFRAIRDNAYEYQPVMVLRKRGD